MDEDNGVLGGVPGEFIGKASSTLPPAQTTTAEWMSVAIDAGWFGPVRIEFVRTLMRHRRNAHWAWVAVRADRAEPEEGGGATM